MMLSWLGEQRKISALETAGAAIEQAVDEVLANPAWRTADLGGSLNTDAFGEKVADVIAKSKTTSSAA
jgi:3-isopropylmalate dehydrogenase